MAASETHTGEGAGARAPVLLVSMPFGPLFRPSIGLGLLQASLKAAGLRAETLYFTFRMAEQTGTALYEQIASGYPAVPALAGEWVFAESLFGPAAAADARGYVEEVLRANDERRAYRKRPTRGADAAELEKFIGQLLALRAGAGAFLDFCLEEVLARRPSVVGFTSLFQQQVASLALARRIKERAPGTFVVFGGANNEGAMGAEVMRSFAFVDAVVSGEGELVFPELARKVLGGETPDARPGVVLRRAPPPDAAERPDAGAAPEMDSLPYADFEDFFRQLGAARLDARRPARVQFETSRGCWWGARQHCTFCGLNGATMAYRSKSAGRALEELTALAGKYPGHPIEVVDNILDMGYFKDFLPELARRRLDLNLFYEVKSNLTKEQVRLLRRAGVREIQPGVESLSTRVLKVMRKGVSGLQNIQLLKWCKELGIRPYWNILWGFPGEPAEEYARMAELIPLLTHLTPPESVGPVRLDRFSPNFTHAAQFGLTDVKPFPSYGYIYPLGDEARFNLAYYFTHRHADGRDVDGYTAPVGRAAAEWAAAHDTSDLFSKDLGAALLVCDLRPVARKPMTVLDGLPKLLYQRCDAAHTAPALARLLRTEQGARTSERDIEAALDRLVGDGLMLEEEGAYLSLAIPLGEYAPRRAVLEHHGLIEAAGAN
ncbi:MAG TPA: RiPP maturation radical SAM C-methyltransferase [Pyrinomonadaceae bacterium]|jgi:ribosomal peptide maturation radical SAM protein 1